ncbi:calcium-binding protein, partial [Bradyrhizobium sp. Gha]|uniref:beta strand repeat-containing protein n=1 Tax=Bradyrhizobium sp. Gha TaxID=1855318 RepID=UPI0008EDEF85
SYSDNTDTPSASTTLTLSINDNGNTGSGGAKTASASSTIDITAVNDAPVNTVPGAQTTNVNTTKAITGLSISDVDAGGGSETVTLSVTNGNLTVSGGTAGISGSGTSTVTLTGTVSAINSTLAATVNYVPTTNFSGTSTLTMTTNDNGHTGTGGALTDIDTVTISVASPSPFTLTTGTDTVVFASGTNTVNGTTATLNSTDKLTGGSGTDTLNVTDGGLGPFTFGNGSGNTLLTNFEKIVLTDTNNGNHTDSITFTSTFQNNGTLTVDGSGIGGNGKLSMDASAVTTGAFVVIGGNDNDTLKGGSGADTINGGNGSDAITGNGGGDTLTGGAGNDTFKYNGVTDSSHSAFDRVTDFTSGSDKVQFNLGDGVNSVANTALTTANGSVAANTAAWFVDTANNQVIVYANPTASALSGGNPGLIEIHLTGTTTFAKTDITTGGTAPAGVAGEPINLALTSPTGNDTPVTLTVTGAPSDWTLSGGTHNLDGSWTVTTNDVSALTVTTGAHFGGALVLDVAETWTSADGIVAGRVLMDNVEAYAPNSPIFAISGDDNLTASRGNDLLVFSQPIGHDTVNGFDVAHDTIDLIGYDGFTSFADVQAHTAGDGAGNAVMTLGDGQSITLNAIDATSLTSNDFVFDQTPTTENSDSMTIGDGAMLPLSGVIHNTGSISLASTGDQTDLQLIEHGITLDGGGQVVLSDSDENFVTGAASDVTLTNVDNTISGAGHLGAGSMILVNEGLIIATGTKSLQLDTGANAITNSGTLEATGTGGLTIDSGVTNSGLIWANGANVVANGDVSGGSALISGSAKLEFADAASSEVKFDFGAAGTLQLDHSVAFTGSVSGLSTTDQLDLRDIVQGSATTATYTANETGTGGTLSVSDGVHTANVAILGQYTADDFEIAADGSGGTLIKSHDPSSIA